MPQSPISLRDMVIALIDAAAERQDTLQMLVEESADRAGQQDAHESYCAQLTKLKGTLEQARDWVKTQPVVPKQPLNLYLISHEDENGELLDLFVTAPSPEETLSLWKEHFKGFSGTADADHIDVRRVPEKATTPTTHDWDDTYPVTTEVHILTGEVRDPETLLTLRFSRGSIVFPLN